MNSSAANLVDKCIVDGVPALVTSKEFDSENMFCFSDKDVPKHGYFPL